MMLLDLGGSQHRINALTANDSADWLFSGDFTLELWKVKFADLTTQRLLGQYNTTGNQRSWLIMYDNATGQLWCNLSTNGSSATQIVFTWAPTVGVEYNIAVDRSGTTVRMYIDGVKVANGTVSGSLHNSTDFLAVGAGRAGSAFTENFNGTCKAVRVTKGTARYATDGSYTVPTLPLPTA